MARYKKQQLYFEFIITQLNTNVGHNNGKAAKIKFLHSYQHILLLPIYYQHGQGSG